MDSMINECESMMTTKIEALDREFSRLRTGKASISLLDGIRVDYYGTPTPLNQVASLSTPDARTINVAPFEKKMLSVIERAIQIADIGVQPNNDGNIIRLPIPPLNEERRKEIAKSIRKIGEDIKVSVRKVRQDYNGKIKKQEKDKEMNEDESKQKQKLVQTSTDRFVTMIDEKVGQKEKEILSI